MKTSELLDYLCLDGRERMRDVMIQSSCIAASRVGLAVLTYFGVRARPVACRVVAANRAFVEHSMIPQRVLSDAELDELGAWSLGIAGTGSAENNGWDGHLVLIVDDRLVDLSADQMSRPHKQLRVEPFHAELQQWPAVFTSDEGAVLMYDPMSEQHSYKRAPDWRRGRYRELIASMIRDLKGRYDTSERTAHAGTI